MQQPLCNILLGLADDSRMAVLSTSDQYLALLGYPRGVVEAVIEATIDSQSVRYTDAQILKAKRISY